MSAQMPVFSRGSGVLEYWLAHAEGLTVEPLGARVEAVVVAAPEGHAETLIVRSRMTGRRKWIPAGAIAAVEPVRGQLLLDAPAPRAHARFPRPSPERIAAMRNGTAHRGRAARAGAVVVACASRDGVRASFGWTRDGACASFSWIRPRARRVVIATAEACAWFAPRAAGAARTVALTIAKLTYAAALLVARGGALAAREFERVLVAAIGHGIRAVERRRRGEP